MRTTMGAFEDGHIIVDSGQLIETSAGVLVRAELYRRSGGETLIYGVDSKPIDGISMKVSTFPFDVIIGGGNHVYAILDDGKVGTIKAIDIDAGAFVELTVPPVYVSAPDECVESLIAKLGLSTSASDGVVFPDGAPEEKISQTIDVYGGEFFWWIGYLCSHADISGSRVKVSSRYPEKMADMLKKLLGVKPVKVSPSSIYYRNVAMSTLISSVIRGCSKELFHLSDHVRFSSIANTKMFLRGFMEDFCFERVRENGTRLECLSGRMKSISLANNVRGMFLKLQIPVSIQKEVRDGAIEYRISASAAGAMSMLSLLRGDSYEKIPDFRYSKIIDGTVYARVIRAERVKIKRPYVVVSSGSPGCIAPISVV